VSNRPSKKRSSSARIQAASRASQGSNRGWIIGIGALVVVGVVIIAAIASSNTSGSGDNISGRKSAPAALVSKVTTIPDSVYAAVGAGQTLALPKPIDGKPIEQNGKPGILYIGAEYCPYCATERWALVNALSRFGTFTNLKITNSSTTDVDPGTKTWSFYKAGYTSDHVAFTAVETEDNNKGTLETPTDAQKSILATYDAPPFVAASSQGSIPFIYFNGEYLISGATFDVGVLQGKTWDQIATAMSQPTSAIAKAAIGAANGITATICLLTDNQPASACSPAFIKTLQTQIKNQPKSTATPTSNSSKINP
jgi:hypothetical protein